MGRNVRCSTVVRTVHTTRDYVAGLSNIPLDVHVCENLVHNYLGLASNFILYINTKDFFFFTVLTYIEFLRSARLNEGGKFCSEFLLRVVHHSGK